MTVGNPRTTNSSKAQTNVGLRFTCLENKDTRFPEVNGFPSKPCKGGIMTEHHFPA